MRDGAEHGARGVDGVAALLEDHRAGGGAERLAGDGHPVPAVQHRLDRALRRAGEREEHAARRQMNEARGMVGTVAQMRGTMTLARPTARRPFEDRLDIATTRQDSLTKAPP